MASQSQPLLVDDLANSSAYDEKDSVLDEEEEVHYRSQPWFRRFSNKVSHLLPRDVAGDKELAEKDLDDTTTQSTGITATVLRASGQGLWSVKDCLLTPAFYLSILPRFLQPGGLRQKRALHSTAYLDAVRGYAALIVTIHHYYGEDPIMWLPFISIVRQGRMMVDIFFGISGFVLTRKMLGLMRQRRDTDLVQCLASSTFRRYLRLYLSATFASFVFMLGLYFNLDFAHERANMGALSTQLTDFAWDALQFMNPYGPVQGYATSAAHHPAYHPFMWTIPVEFRGSLVVFLFCAACARLTPARRTIVCWILITFAFIWSETWAALFLFGVFLAERSLTREQRRMSLPSITLGDVEQEIQRRGARRAYVTSLIVSGVGILIGCFLAGQPYELTGAWPWSCLSQAIPHWWPQSNELREHFWLGIGSALILIALEECPTYQRPFEWAFSQYIGELSFGLYAMQLPVANDLFLRDVFTNLRSYTGVSRPAKILEWLLYTFVLLWTADYFIRVDRRIIAFGRWLEKKTFVKSRD